MINKKYALSNKVLTTTGSIFFAGSATLYAQSVIEPIEELEETTVLASRFNSPTTDTTSSISSITDEELENQQLTRVSDSLSLIPGVQSVPLGSTGNAPLLLTRGLPTGFAQVVVDGVSISNSSNQLGTFLTAAGNAQTSRLEFLRGPQSVLYGGDAVGGVLGYETKIGGENKISLFGEGGSFDSYKTSASASGTIDKLEYGYQIGEEFTNNDPTGSNPLEDYTLQTQTLGLKLHATDDLSFKFTYRGADSEFDAISISPFGTSTSRATVETDLLTLNTEFVANDVWTTKLILGRYEEEFSLNGVFSSAFGDFAFNPENSFEEDSINWINELTLSHTLKAVVGYEYSNSEFNNSDGRDIDFHNNGFYLNSYWTPTEPLLIEAGVRIEDHSEFGSDTAWNVGAAYHFASTGTRVSSRIAESFRTPRTIDTEAFQGGFTNQIANPNLETETTLGYELKISQEIAQRHSIHATYFHQEVEEAIFTERFADFSTQQQNASGQSTVSGIELEAQGSFMQDRLNYRAAWTIQDREEVIDVPDQLISADINYNGDTWLVGLSANYVDGASYQNPASNADGLDDRIVTRLYGHYEINKHVKIHARIENLFNESYEISPFGDQGPGNERGYFAGVTISW